MRRLRRVVFLAASSLVVVACLPARDNAADPAIRPSVSIELSTSERGPGGIGCLSADTVSSQVTRSQCLTVRATGTDPQGDGTVVGYAFTVVTTSGAPTTIPRMPTAGTSSSAMATFSIGAYDDLKSSARYDVLVEVVDADGHPGKNTERFTVRNTPPSAVSPGTRLVPNWGGAWRTGGTYPIDLTLHFSAAASFDADGDTLQYKWDLKESPSGTLERNSGVLGVWSSNAQLALVVPADPAAPDGILLELQVTDGQLTDRSVATAQLDALPAWAFEDGTGKVLILDVNRSVRKMPDDYRGGAAAFLWDPTDLLNGSELLFHTAVNDVLRKRKLGSVTEAQRLLDGAILGIYVPEFPTSWFWTVTAPQSGGTQVNVIRSSDLALLASLPDPATASGFELSFGAVDRDTDDLWFGGLGSTSATGWSYDEQTGIISLIDSFPTSSGRLLTGLALRRQAGGGRAQVWMVESRDVFAGGTPGVVDVTVVRSPGATTGNPDRERASVEVHFPLDFGLTLAPEIGFSMEWATPETAWLNLFSVGMASFELCGPAGQRDARLCLATLAPEFPAAFDFAMNRKTGTNLGISFEGHTLGRIGVDGTSTVLDIESTIDDLIGPDPGGRIWTVIRGENNTNYIHRGNGAGQDGIILRSALALGFGDPTIDFSTGDLWTPSVFPAAAIRYYADGRVADVITGVSGSGVPVLLSPPDVTAPDPETGALWIVTGGGPDPSGLGTRVYLADPYAPRARTAPGVAPAAAGVANPVLDTNVQFGGGEGIFAAVAQVHGHALVMLTRTSKGNGVTGSPCRLDAAPLDFHYYLRRLSPDGSLFPPATSSGVCAVSDYRSQFGNDQVALARDIVTGEVCVAARKKTAPEGARIARFGTNLQPVFSGLAPAPNGGGIGYYVSDLAAAPGQCWLGVNESDMTMVERGRVFVATPGAVVPGPARVHGSDLALNLPEISAVRPTVGPSQANLIIGSDRAWVGGYEQPLVPITFNVVGTSGVFVLGTSDSLSVSFETKFVRP